MTGSREKCLGSREQRKLIREQHKGTGGNREPAKMIKGALGINLGEK